MVTAYFRAEQRYWNQIDDPLPEFQEDIFGFIMI